ncbi:MAG: 30S ribosomal protein S5 [Candidatus Pacebacteria bacterium]|nr:30S ribosomal protein S5 [Candidatus Paceibacterota bacterium]
MNKKEDSTTTKTPFKKGSFKRKKREKPEFDQKVIDVARVTRVVKGGKRFSFRTVVIIGDKKGKVGVGVSKGKDMRIATEKSYADAKKNLITLSFSGNTIPYRVDQKLGSAKILLKPAVKGNGIVAGGAVRTVVSLAGVKDISAKMLGSKSKLNNARATIEALKQFSVKKTREIILESEEKSKREAEQVKNTGKEEKNIKKTDETKEVKKKDDVKKTEKEK